jgi:hypothetical protein
MTVDPTKLNQPTVPASAQAPLFEFDRDHMAVPGDHVARAGVPAEEGEAILHLGAGGETACGKPREGMHVTDHAGVFELARAGKMSSERRVCPACAAARPGSGYRG